VSRLQDPPSSQKPNEEWQRIASAPFDKDLELSVVNYDGVHALVFPCRRVLGGWINAETKERIDLHPTHWREWTQNLAVCFPLFGLVF